MTRCRGNPRRRPHRPGRTGRHRCLPGTGRPSLPAAGVFGAIFARPAPARQAVTETDLAAFSPRHIGPAVTGGRIHDVEAPRGDPGLPLTVEEYREREAFLLEILAVLDRLEGAASEVPDQRRRLIRLHGAINGGGVRRGTLHPPTTTQREQLERIREELGRAGRGVAGPGSATGSRRSRPRTGC